MESLAERILGILSNLETVNSLDVAKRLNEDHQKVVGAIKSIQANGDVIVCEQVSTRQWELTKEGEEVAGGGSHEALIFNAVPDGGIAQAELMRLVPNAKVGFSKAMSSGWVAIVKCSEGLPRVQRKVSSIQDVVQQNLVKIRDSVENNIADSIKQDYKKRKLVQEIVIKSINLSKGSEFGVSLSKLETDLTQEMITSGSWQSKKFKNYNFDALGVSPTRGHLHPLMRVRAQFRQIFLEMGFTEMPTNNFVESSFWNFDALFQPQQHPARDAHDTFFISDPATASSFPMDYLERVKKVHQEGAYGSQGYKYEWKIEEARKNLLRTHTTAVSARMLYKLAQQKVFKPVKYFSIDRVFRNETLDATHLAEFFQIEGVVADYGLTLGDLIGVLFEFFKKLGITKLRFKPAYNPYTEPSMEIFSYHEGLKRWVEVGNSGLFRPEMLLPMGLPSGVTVIAWGLSLERPTMIKFGIDNIRDLVGHKVNLQMVYEAPICRLDKGDRRRQQEEDHSISALEARQERILSQLDTVRDMLNALAVRDLAEGLGSDIFRAPGLGPIVPVWQPNRAVKHPRDVVIYARPECVPLSLLVLARQLSKNFSVIIRQHLHSNLPPCASEDGISAGSETGLVWRSDVSVPNNSNSVRLTLLLGAWMDSRPTMMVDPILQIAISGEANVARYLASLLDPPYDSASPITATCIDEWLDVADKMVAKQSNLVNLRSSAIKRLADRLSKHSWLVGSEVSLADVVVWSVLRRRCTSSLPVPIRQWLDRCSRHRDFDVAGCYLDANKDLS